MYIQTYGGALMVWIIALAIGMYLVVKLISENRTSGLGQMQGSPLELTDDEEDDLQSRIQNVSNAKELMEIAADYNFDTADSKAFLSMAVALNADLTQEDWADIYESAAEGSELESLAEQKAGDQLV